MRISTIFTPVQIKKVNHYVLQFQIMVKWNFPWYRQSEDTEQHQLASWLITIIYVCLHQSCVSFHGTLAIQTALHQSPPCLLFCWCHSRHQRHGDNVNSSDSNPWLLQRCASACYGTSAGLWFLGPHRGLSFPFLGMGQCIGLWSCLSL